jgi:hypothetical protein
VFCKSAQWWLAIAFKNDRWVGFFQFFETTGYQHQYFFDFQVVFRNIWVLSIGYVKTLI